MIALVRVDNRLVHGQVVQAWLPYLSAKRMLVLDDEAANSPLVRAAMELCVPPDVSVDVAAIDEIEAEALARAAANEAPILVLVRDVADAARARARGLAMPSLNLGNVHHASGRLQVSPSVYLSPEEVGQLERFAADGIDVEIRALPTDRPLTLAEIHAKLAPAR